MGKEITPIVVAKETVSDDSYIVVDNTFQSGDAVKKSEIIGSFESSKSIFEVDAPVSGYIHYNVSEGQKVSVGAVYAAVSDSIELPDGYFSQVALESEVSAAEPQQDTGSIRVSKSVRKLLDQNNIDISVFSGRSILRLDDVHEYLRSAKASSSTTSSSAISIGESHNSLVIIGGGGHAKMCIDLIKQMGTFKIQGIVDSAMEIGEKVLNVPVIGGMETLSKLYEKGVRHAVVGFGSLRNPALRQEAYSKLKAIGYIIPNIVHPSAMIETSASLGEGNQVMAGAIIGSGVRVGNNSVINSGSIVSHDCVIANNVHITPGAILAGSVSVGDNSLIGMGVTVMIQVKIGQNVIISNGIRIVKDVSDSTVLKG